MKTIRDRNQKEEYFILNKKRRKNYILEVGVLREKGAVEGSLPIELKCYIKIILDLIKYTNTHVHSLLHSEFNHRFR